MVTWKSMMTEMEKSDKFLTDELYLYELAVYQYGFIAYCIGIKDDETAGTYLYKAKENVEKLIEANNNWAEVYALKGVLYGYEIYLSQFKAVYLGARSTENLDKALELDSDCFSCKIEKANQLYYTPSMFGGNKSDALELYVEAVSYYNKNIYKTEDWYYLNVLRQLADVYEKNGDFENANSMYLKILKYEPNFKWVNEELYPEFQIRYRDWVRGK
jgi:tetratricopeptide (TPR) repeat protein